MRLDGLGLSRLRNAGCKLARRDNALYLVGFILESSVKSSIHLLALLLDCTVEATTADLLVEEVVHLEISIASQSIRIALHFKCKYWPCLGVQMDGQAYLAKA
jgi:hypothetical protein